MKTNYTLDIAGPARKGKDLQFVETTATLFVQWRNEERAFYPQREKSRVGRRMQHRDASRVFRCDAALPEDLSGHRTDSF
jgi:hypothetical protein